MQKRSVKVNSANVWLCKQNFSAVDEVSKYVGRVGVKVVGSCPHTTAARRSFRARATLSGLRVDFLMSSRTCTFSAGR